MKISLKGLHKKCEKLWSEYIHLRDRVCRVCGGIDNTSPHHICIRNKHSVCFDPDNGVLLCFKHHRWAHDSVSAFKSWLEKTFGVDQIFALHRKSNDLVKLDRSFYEENIANLLRLIKLQKDKENT
jgi:hypothetical protein